jgi:hypothetical protein
MLGARRVFRSAVLALALLLVAPAASALVTVGPGCRFTKLQDAINLVLNNERGGSADPFISVVGGLTYNEALNLDGSNIGSYDVFGTTFDHPFVQIYGDYEADCVTEVTEGGSMATLSAAGKSATALSIHGNKPVSVVLNHLTISNANLSGSGGGINFTGSGTLDLTNVDLANNVADFGGGMLASGQSSGITITLHTNTRIYGNTARQSGGGILVENIARLVDLESPTLLWMNTADPGSSSGFGGGLEIYGQASADIGGTYIGLGVVSSNHAKYGGGIAVLAGGGLRLFSTVAGDPALVTDNTADASGGGLYVDGSSVCASGYAIDNNKAGIPNGTLGEGSAISVTGGGDVHLTETQLVASDGNAGFACGHGFPLPQRALCPVGIPCNEVNDNGTITGDDSIFFVGSSAGLVADRFESRRNQARFLAYSVASLKLGDCLIAGNTTLSSLIANSGVTQINGCTLAENAISAAGTALFATTGAGSALTLANSILALNTSAGNPATSLNIFEGTVQATDIIASEIMSLNPAAGSNVNSLDPAFVDPAIGDYHLKPESPAVDYHLTTNPDLFQPFKDLDGRGRGKPLLSHLRANGSPNDIGAYELQSLGDLIFVDSMDEFR